MKWRRKHMSGTNSPGTQVPCWESGKFRIVASEDRFELRYVNGETTKLYGSFGSLLFAKSSAEFWAKDMA